MTLGTRLILALTVPIAQEDPLRDGQIEDVRALIGKVSLEISRGRLRLTE